MCRFGLSMQSPAPADISIFSQNLPYSVDCFIVRRYCRSYYRVGQICFVSTARSSDQLCLSPPLSPIRGGLVEARTHVRAEPLQSPAPVESDVQSPAPAVHAHSKMASSSAGSSRDGDWLRQMRSRQMEQRRTAGSPGVERWKAIEAATVEAAEEATAEIGPAKGRATHEILRSDLSNSLAFHEPQADSLIVEGRPTQVIFEIHIMHANQFECICRTLLLLYACRALRLQRELVCCRPRTLQSYICIYEI